MEKVELMSYAGKLAVLLAAISSLCLDGFAQKSKTPSESYTRLVERYCVSCHNEELNTANLRLDNVDLTNIQTHAPILEKVVHKLRSGDMPPFDKPQPSAGARNALLSYLVESLDEEAKHDPNPGRPAVYRLNRAEYQNAIRDLLALEIDGAALLPTDGSDFGFDNIADSLTVSPMLLDRYMLANPVCGALW
jgi:hypothetical protein